MVWLRYTQALFRERAMLVQAGMGVERMWVSYTARITFSASLCLEVSFIFAA